MRNGVRWRTDRGDRRPDWQRLRFYIAGIRRLTGTILAPAAGLSLGFNELDGD